MKTEHERASRTRFTLKDMVQGKPLGHPSHAMVVHFPVAFALGALGLDLLSHLGRFPQAPVAGTWLLMAAVGMAVIAAATGLVDWWGMIPGSRKRRRATQHLLAQLSAFSVFALELALRWPDRHLARSPWGWIALGLVGAVPLLLGQWLGGTLVYGMGMRVSTGSHRSG